MRAVDVGISHDDDFVIADLAYIEGHITIEIIVLSHIVVAGQAGTDGGNHGLQLVVAKNLVLLCLFDIEHLSPQRQNCLEPSVPALFCRSACRVTLDDEHFTLGRVLLRAVCKLARKAAAFALLADLLTCLAGCDASQRCIDDLFQNHFSLGGELIKIVAQLLIYKRENHTGNR
ncbi:hypothetical protein DSECCO2_529550 [anaerobic digester metagenome]